MAFPYLYMRAFQMRVSVSLPSQIPGGIRVYLSLAKMPMKHTPSSIRFHSPKEQETRILEDDISCYGSASFRLVENYVPGRELRERASIEFNNGEEITIGRKRHGCPTIQFRRNDVEREREETPRYLRSVGRSVA